MKYLKILSISLILIFFSCSKKNNDISQTTLEIPYESHNNFIMLSKYFKTIKFLPLETNKESIIGSIKKLKIINNRIYIFDNIGNSILVFNSHGQFEKKISSIGSGPDEYISISDFDVENNNLYIMDISGKILHFKNDVYVNSIKIDFRATDFCITKGGFIFKILEFDNKSGQFIATSKDLKIKNKLLPISEPNSKKFKFNYGFSNNFGINNSKTYFSQNFSRSIYELDDEEFTFKHEYVLDFGSKSLPENDNVNNYDMLSPDFKFLVRNNFYFHNNYIILDYFHNNVRRIDWIDTGKNIHNVGIPKNDINKIPFIPKWGFNDGLVGFMNAEQLIDEEDLMKNVKIKNIKTGDNPILMIYTFND
ncbi:6-bladed beta-propeller [Tamlana sp. 62-3]|uniref:6-bladed beta-propeller n=1 Tax=Neotamlana sargassicola TaxID=2883125 RepID=A0A9X1I701_9FLAO|nr:6-bladed beta-propeller [Tamlana sargassicola]MCB4807944.1 6-bladed beta-propeller [Tamlana sargassicola]